MNSDSKKWLLLVVVLLLLAGVAYFYPFLRVLAPSSMGVELLTEVENVEAGVPVNFDFAIVDEEGVRVKEFEVSHEKLLHMIVVRDDLQHFQHVHPVLDESTGVFSVGLTLPAAGTYTVYEDFVADERTILSFPMSVEGEYLPVEQVVSSGDPIAVGSYMVAPDFPESIVMGEPISYSFDVSLDGQDVTLENYLGESGHSVLVHEGDLDLIHTHAEMGTLSFMTVLEKTGLYKVFTEFQVEGRVYLVEYVFEVGSRN